jgi:hypothetical protein
VKTIHFPPKLLPNPPEFLGWKKKRKKYDLRDLNGLENTVLFGYYFDYGT